MFENLIAQDAGTLLSSDIANGTLPGAILLSGPECSGKLSCALELARVLSCRGTPQGEWNCTCPSCMHHKALTSPDLLLTGPRDCSLEIAAATRAFLQAAADNSGSLHAVHYLFIRSVRKLTLRFSQQLWENDDKLPKIAPLLSDINDILEELDPARTLPEFDKLTKLCTKLTDLCGELESKFMYDSLPVQQIRSVGEWAHLTSALGKKVLIIENADRMQESVRNALLKTLEEPPEDVLFILTTAHRGAVMPTILSRVRTYTFAERSGEDQQQVITRVFRAPAVPGQTIQGYLQTFLPVSPAAVCESAHAFLAAVAAGRLPDCAQTVKTCGGFEPRILFSIFINGMTESMKPMLQSAAGAETAAQCIAAVRQTYNNVTVYNQSITGALEELVRSLAAVNRQHDGVLTVS